MRDLIDRNAVMLRVREFIGNPTYDELMLVNDLNALPSVELERTAKVDRDMIFPVKVCGICHYTVDYPNKYCSECGAKLDWSE